MVIERPRGVHTFLYKSGRQGKHMGHSKDFQTSLVHTLYTKILGNFRIKVEPLWLPKSSLVAYK